MRDFLDRVHGTLEHFGFVDIGILKLCLVSIGILLGVYFTAFFDRFVVVVWILFILSWLYIVVKVFGSFVNRD